MQTETILYIILAGIIALFIALFQYWYKSKHKLPLSVSFTVLRFLTIFAILLLLINPKFEQLKVYTEKPRLVLAVDNSNSIKHLNQDKKALEFLESVKNNTKLTDKFDVDVLTFGEGLLNSDSIHFKSKETNIDEALHQISEIYKGDIAPVILLSDGNQTFGNDYAINTKQIASQPVYPVILGDTVRYTDLKIQQFNINKYAFLKNKFPVEAIVTYKGNGSVKTKFTIKKGGRVLYTKNLSFNKQDNSKIITAYLPANSVGVSSYKAEISPLTNEKNTINNIKNFAVEVIDEKTKIAIVSDMSHPDIGALKKSIESNEQRSVSIVNSSKILSQINDFQLFITYQPNNRFKRLFDVLKSENKNKFTIIGSKTNLRFLNNNVSDFTNEVTGQVEDTQAKLNLNFTPFIVDAINFESFPPLKSPLGDVSFTVPFETVLEKTILGIERNQPLLATFETNGRREAVLFGENIWQWRAQSFLNSKSFNPFDDFMGKITQYLASSKKRSRLNLDYESFYNGNSNVIINAQVFDKNYQFDARKTLELKLKNNTSKEEKTLPFILKNNNYQIDLSGLSASNYSFTAKTKDGTISKSGSFEILEYNIEQQFLNADVTKLQQLATHTNGKSYFINNYDALVPELLNNEQFKPIQKSNKNTIPLIDWKYLLALIALTLSAEWFLRKYNGLI